MKKRIITLLAVVALLVVCAVFTAPEAEAATARSYYQSADWTCPCCGKTGDQLTFYTWGTANNPIGQYALAAGYHYFLGSASTSGSQRTISGTGKCVVIVTNSAGSAVTHATNSSKSIRFMEISSGQEVYLIGNNATIKASRKDGEAGGAIAVWKGGALHLSGSLTIKGQDDATGVPSTGGLIYNAGTVTMDGVTLDASSTREALAAAGNGGAITNQGTMTINNCTITGGSLDTEKGNGGAIYNDATLTITNSTITGSSCFRGGIYNSGTMTVEGGTINGGYAVNRGGALMSTGTTKLKDVTVNAHTQGSDMCYRGIMVADGNCYLYGTTVVNSAGKSLADGVGVTAGTVTLADSASVVNASGEHYKNIWLWNTDKCIVQVDRSWTGTASVYSAAGATLSNHGGIYGQGYLKNGTLNEDFTFTQATGTDTKAVNLFLENPDHDHPKLTCYGGDFVTCRAQLVEDGVATGWYLRPQDAFNAYKASDAEEKYVKLWANYATTNTVDELYVDFHGRTGGTWTNNAGKTLYAFDSTADAGEAGVTVTTAGEGTLAPVTQINGKTYVNNAGTIYPVEVKVTNVSLRPGTEEASMYYTAKVTAHADAGIDAWGVAITLNENETVLGNHLYTRETDASKMGAFNGVLVKGIAKNGDNENADRANTPIYAKAYIEVDGQVAMSATVNKTLKEVVTAVLALDLEGVQAQAVAAMQQAAWFADINA